MDTNDVIFDAARFVDTCVGDLDLVREVLEVGIPELLESRELMLAAIEAGNASAARTWSFRLRSGIRNLCCVRGLTATWEIESRIAAGRLDEVGRLLPDFNRTFETTLLALRQFQESL